MTDIHPVIPKAKNGSGPHYTPRSVRPKRRAIVIPVSDWTIARALFWNRDERGKVKPPV